MVEYLGWAATAIFVGSYFCRRAERLRRAQMAGAVLWIVYGFIGDPALINERAAMLFQGIT